MSFKALFLFFLFLKILFIYFTEREIASQRENTECERKKQATSRGAWHGARTQNPEHWDHALSHRQTLKPECHPGAPIDIFRTLHPRTTEYSFFLNAHGTFSRLYHILGLKTGLIRYQKTEIISCIFSDHNALKLELNHKEKFGRNSKHLETKNHPAQEWLGKQGNREGDQTIFGDQWKWKHIGPKPMGHCIGSPKGKIHSHPSLTQKNRKI